MKHADVGVELECERRDGVVVRFGNPPDGQPFENRLFRYVPRQLAQGSVIDQPRNIDPLP